MISKTPLNIQTADQLLTMPADGNRYELVGGKLNMMSPAGSEHGEIAGRIFMFLANHVSKKKLGKVYAAETGFRIASKPDTVRAPDAAFVSHHRLATVEPTRGFLPLAPDLVVEVVSPGDSFSDVDAKAAGWLAAGSLAVLVANPENQTIHVYQPKKGIVILKSGDTYHADDACAGFQLAIDDAFMVG